jgi:hypothetical protein
VTVDASGRAPTSLTVFSSSSTTRSGCLNGAGSLKTSAKLRMNWFNCAVRWMTIPIARSKSSRFSADSSDP